MKRVLTLCFISILSVTGVEAEYLCSSDVTFKWVKEGLKEAQQVPWGSVQAKGEDEAQAKAKLAESTVKQRQKAAEYCRKYHENLTSCIATKFNTTSYALQNMDYAMRKALSEAIASDCKATQGVCSETSASEPNCAQVVSKDAAGDAEEGSKGGKEADKSKKK